MQRRDIQPRDLIVDTYGNRCIVRKRASAPHPKWLARQKDVRLRDPGLLVWWSALPLSGGSACVPDDLVELIGEATGNDVSTAARNGGPTAASILKELFPEHFSAE